MADRNRSRYVNGFSASDPRAPIERITNSGRGRELSHSGIPEVVDAQLARKTVTTYGRQARAAAPDDTLKSYAHEVNLARLTTLNRPDELRLMSRNRHSGTSIPDPQEVHDEYLQPQSAA